MSAYFSRAHPPVTPGPLFPRVRGAVRLAAGGAAGGGRGRPDVDHRSAGYLVVVVAQLGPVHLAVGPRRDVRPRALVAVALVAPRVVLPPLRLCAESRAASGAARRAVPRPAA